MTAAERRLRFWLRVTAAGLGGAVVIYALGPVVGPTQDTFSELPFNASSAAKVGMLGLLCLFAAGDLRVRHGLVPLVVAAHVVSVSAMALMLAAADTGRDVPFFGGTTDVSTLLLGAIALDGVITLALLVLYLLARRAASWPAGGPAETAVSGSERRLRLVLGTLAVLFAAGAVAYLAGPLVGATEAMFAELPFVTNSAVKAATLALIAVYVLRDVRRNLALAGVIVAGLAIQLLVAFTYVWLPQADHALPLGDGEIEVASMLWFLVAEAAVTLLVLLPLYLRAWTDRYGLRFLRPMEFRALVGAADVLIAGEEEQVAPERVAMNMDGYMSRMRARRRWVYRVTMFMTYARPLLAVLPPFSELDRETRVAWLQSRFRRPRLAPTWTRAAIRVCQQLSYAGYYNDPDTFDSVGYKRFSARDRVKTLDIPTPQRHPLRVEGPTDVEEGEVDVCIVGSGAGGAILAYRLAEQGHRVLVLERGEYVEPRHFSDDEVEMFGRLYADGIMQQTQDFRFTILQGSCVGGSTTVNNAVSFPPPAAVLERWRQFGAGLDLGRLEASTQAVERFLSIAPQHGVQLNPSAVKFVEGAAALGLSPGELEVDVVRANIAGCFGSGYCNIGCPWGRKLSMLDTALPWAQSRFPDRLRIMSDCEVTRIRQLSGSPRTIVDVRARSRRGGEDLKVTIKAKAFVLSAGAVGSSYLMLRSGVGRGLPVGKRLCFNMGAPMTAEFEEKLDAYDGLQISHYGLPSDNGFAFETWFNPPVAQALNMPGWFDQHFHNMRVYDHLMAVGVLVGTKATATVKQAWTGGADVKYKPDPDDLATMAKGMRLLGEILFEAGAKRVMLNTWDYEEFHPGDDLGRLVEVVRRPGYLTLGTGHPQGGNAMSDDRRRGVVRSDFRVHGYDNLYVCDASVFPSALTVNPQLTVMSLAHYAADEIRVPADA